MSSCPIPIEFPQSIYFSLAFFVCWCSAFCFLAAAAFAFKFRSQWRNFLEDWVGLILYSPRCLLPSPARANWILFCHFVLDLRLCWGSSGHFLFLLSRYTFPVAMFICCLLGSLQTFDMGLLFVLRLMYTCLLLCLRLFSFICFCDLNGYCDDMHVLTMFVVSISYSLSSLTLLQKLKETTNQDPTIRLQIGSGASVVGMEAVLFPDVQVGIGYGQQAQAWLDSLPAPDAIRFSDWSTLLRHCRCGRRIVLNINKDGAPAS